MFQYTPTSEKYNKKGQSSDFGQSVMILYDEPRPILKDYIPEPRTVPERFKDYAQDIKDFPVRNDDIFTISYPKTGSTLLSELVTVLLNGVDFSKLQDVPLLVRSPFIE